MPSEEPFDGHPDDEPEYDDYEHYDDDYEHYDYDHEVFVPTQEQIAALPQESGDAVYFYASALSQQQTRNPPATSPAYYQDMRGYSPRNAYRWVLDCNGTDMAVLATPQPSLSFNSRAIENTIRQYFNMHPDMSDPAFWCSNNLECQMPYKWAGNYVAAVGAICGSTRGLRVVSDQRYNCYHCALQASRLAVTTLRPFPNPQLFCEGAEIYEEYMPYTEVIGDAFETSATIKDVTGTIPNSCGNCGRIGHTSTTCAYQPKVYDKVGIEIEGRFIDRRRVIRRMTDAGGPEGYSDSSVHSSPDDNSSAEPWEFQTIPGSLRKACQQLVDFYPDETDASCGMHVHVSFDAVEITMLNSPAFFAYFKRRWEEWGARMCLARESQFFRRLRGSNRFCLPAGDREYRISSMDRYSQLNFSSFGEHGTVECRMLPMFKRSSLGVAAVQELLDIYETYLHDMGAHGHPGFEKSTVMAPAAVIKHEFKRELEIPAAYTSRKELTLELAELAPTTEGRIRVAMPVNQPITVLGLSQAVQAKKDAA